MVAVPGRAAAHESAAVTAEDLALPGRGAPLSSANPGRSSFFLLSERMRHGIVAQLGWRDLRPVQEVAIPPILAGDNVLVLAPTAGGKTESAALPVLDLLASAGCGRLGALYLSPLRALLNNQEPRLGRLASLVGLSAFKWHGDVGAHLKARFVRQPAQLLMITPESLEVVLTSPSYDRPALLADLRCVIVDEIHAFAGDDRGDHLICLLERLGAYTRHDLQRIGLSATVGDPQSLLEWLQGSSRRPARLVAPPPAPSRRALEIHPQGEFEDPVREAARLARGRKSLFFAESRGKVEKVKAALEELGVHALVHHSSLSREVREAGEQAFRQGTNCCIVCTRTMELGLDVGDLDLVLQLDAPSSVSAFLQRLGRTGRREGSRGHMAFFTDEKWGFLRASALVSLALRGQVEPVAPSRCSAHLFLHQTLARILEHRGLSRGQLVQGLPAFCFSELTVGDREAVLDHLLENGILATADGRLVLGPAGEKEFGRAHFRELYSVFEAPRELSVTTFDGQRLGRLECWFAQVSGDKPFCFLLAGQAWRAARCDWARSILWVEPAESGSVPGWSSDARLFPRRMCEEIRALLVASEPPAFLGDPGQKLLARLRDTWGHLLRPARLAFVRRGDRVNLFTFAGGRVNNVIAKLFERETGGEARVDNYAVRVDLAGEGRWSADLEVVLDHLAGGLKQAEVEALVQPFARARLSKYQPWLPPRLESRLLAERLLDLEGAVELAGEDRCFREETD